LDRSLLVVVALELLAPFDDGWPTAHPARMEAVGALFEDVTRVDEEVKNLTF
jgi:hypothetical protein